MTALTEAHLKKLPDEDLRAIALRALNDAVSALDTSIEEHDLTNRPDLDPAPVHEAADWISEVLTNPGDGYSDDTLSCHSDAVYDFCNAASDVGESTTGDGYTFPPSLNADVVYTLFYSVADNGGTPHRPSAVWLHDALVDDDFGFMPSHETAVGYVLKVLCDSDDPRLPALAESYLQSGLHVNLRPAIDEAANQLALLDELADLTR